MTEIKLNTGTSTEPKWESVDLPEDFSMTLNLENVFYTKSGQYSYDCTLSMLSAVNAKIFGSMHRRDVTKKGKRFDCLLIVDNRVVIDRGTALVTSIGPESISLQLLGGNADVNFRNRMDEEYIDKIDLGNAMDDIIAFQKKYKMYSSYQRNISGLRAWLTFASSRGMVTKDEPYGDNYEYLQTGLIADAVMRTSDDFPFVMLPSYDTNNSKNVNVFGTMASPANSTTVSLAPKWPRMYVTDAQGTTSSNFTYCPQPFIVTIIEKVMNAIGYTVRTNQIRQSVFKNVYIVNTTATVEYRQMLPHWSVNEFMTQIENFFGCVFVFSTDKKVDILTRESYYTTSNPIHLDKVYDDSWQSDTEQDSLEDVTASTISFKTQDEDKYEMFDDTILDNAIYLSGDDPSFILNSNAEPRRHAIIVTDEDNRQFIANGSTDPDESVVAVEANQLRKLDRGDSVNQLELSISPAKRHFILTQIQNTLSRSPENYSYDGPGSASFNLETGVINIESYLETGEFEEGNDGNIIVVAVWGGIDASPTRTISTSTAYIQNVYTAQNAPFWYGWTHGYDRSNRGLNQRSPALRLVNVEYIDTLGNTFYGDGMSSTRLLSRIDSTVAIEVRFAHADNNLDLRRPFVFEGHMYVCVKIEMSINAKGFEKVKTGTFYRIK